MRELLTFDLLRWLKPTIAPNAVPSATPIAKLCAMFPDVAPYAAPIAAPIATPTPIPFPFLDKQLSGLLFVISSNSLILVPSNLAVLRCIYGLLDVHSSASDTSWQLHQRFGEITVLLDG